MTEEEADKAAAKLDAEDREKEAKALEKFKKGPVPKLDWMMDRLIGEMLSRIATVRSGAAPDPIGGYTRDELARMLASKTYCEYFTRRFMREYARKSSADADPGYYSQTIEARCWTPQFGHWRQLVTALIEYLHEAAIFAKHVNPASTAARLYLRAWRIANAVYTRADGYSQATPDEALSIIRLEKVAADRLWIDAQFAALPPFKGAKKSARRQKAAKGA